MTGTYVFAAYEFEFPIHYKRKTFVDEEKQDNKVTTWFSSQVPTVYQGVMVGVQVAQGAQLKFKYYLTDFYKKSYTDASSTQPWADFDASTMYVSLSMQILKGTDYVYKRGE
jgi:cytochrome bd-type quinol oxidase subunit 2